MLTTTCNFGKWIYVAAHGVKYVNLGDMVISQFTVSSSVNGLAFVQKLGFLSDVRFGLVC
jgi:hypothetical protein